MNYEKLLFDKPFSLRVTMVLISIMTVVPIALMRSGFQEASFMFWLVCFVTVHLRDETKVLAKYNIYYRAVLSLCMLLAGLTVPICEMELVRLPEPIIDSIFMSGLVVSFIYVQCAFNIGEKKWRRNQRGKSKGSETLIS